MGHQDLPPNWLRNHQSASDLTTADAWRHLSQLSRGRMSTFPHFKQCKHFELRTFSKHQSTCACCNRLLSCAFMIVATHLLVMVCWVAQLVISAESKLLPHGSSCQHHQTELLIEWSQGNGIAWLSNGRKELATGCSMLGCFSLCVKRAASLTAAWIGFMPIPSNLAETQMHVRHSF